MLAGNISDLAEFLADDCVYVHNSGASESKAEYLDRIATGDLLYRRLDVVQANVREVNDIVLVNGVVRIDVRATGVEKNFLSRFLQVWVQRNGAWQMTAWQSTTLAPAFAAEFAE